MKQVLKTSGDSAGIVLFKDQIECIVQRIRMIIIELKVNIVQSLDLKTLKVVVVVVDDLSSLLLLTEVLWVKTY